VLFPRNGGDHAFTTLDPSEHVRKRKSFAAFYAVPNLAKYEDRMTAYIQELAEVSSLYISANLLFETV
jgi:hypothetical protein